MILKRIFILLTVVFSLMLPLNTFAEELEKGQGTVKEAIQSGNKEFYTIVTPTEKTYYLVIDYDNDDRNVYFLKAVDEVDLIDLAGVNEVIYTPQETTTIETTTETTSQEDINSLIEEDKQTTEQKSFNLLSIIALVLFILLMVYVVYSKIKDKNKPTTFDDYDDDEEEIKEEENDFEDDSQEVLEGLKNKTDRL